MEDLVNMRVTGHVVITDQDTGEVVLDKYNAVNTQNLSLRSQYPFIIFSPMLRKNETFLFSNHNLLKTMLKFL